MPNDPPQGGRGALKTVDIKQSEEVTRAASRKKRQNENAQTQNQHHIFKNPFPALQKKDDLKSAWKGKTGIVKINKNNTK